MPTLDELRQRLNEIDAGLIDLIAERQEKSREIARVKRATGHATRDYAREREVILGAREAARQRGVSPQVAETLMRMLIRSSLATQEQASVAAHGAGSGQRALVIGGAGKMGRWFVRFLSIQGYTVEIADPGGPVTGFRQRARFEDGPLDHDLIVLATPLLPTAQLLDHLAVRPPPGVVFDVGSLKSPVAAGLRRLAAAGGRVCSVHPMFGPDTRLLSKANVIFCDVGCPEATHYARSLFQPTMARLVDLALDEHDRFMAKVLGLSHATNLAFADALARSGDTAAGLTLASSTTFDAQLTVARRVSNENPYLYFEIQALNPYGVETLDQLAAAVADLRASVVDNDVNGFVERMTRGRRALAG
jgi:chorismate mutase/prephenate dehydrogenase